MLRRVRVAVAICYLLCVAIRAVAQAKLPEFDVASVKPANPNGSVIGIFTYPGGRILASQMTVQLLLREAFHVQGYQIVGGPRWMNELRYDIDARPAPGAVDGAVSVVSNKATLTDEQRQMLLALLIERFGLQFHREKRQGTVYVLERSGKPLLLKTPLDPTLPSWAGAPQGGAVGWGTGLKGMNITMPELAVRISGWVERPVMDQTGLRGAFDFEYKTGDDDPNAEALATIITSLDPLGLRLKAAKGPVEMVVIDKVEMPTAN